MSVTELKSPQTLSDQLLESLTTAIVKGDIAPGEKISEASLAERFNTSRGPLREAIRRLEGLRLVERIPHAGARVVVLTREELSEIYQIREALEGMAARLAARNMTDKEISELRALLDAHEQGIAESEGKEYFQREGDFDFHYRVIQGARNRRLIDLLCGELYHLIRMYRYRASQAVARPPQALAEHRHILRAIEQRDEELAEMLMRRHISGAGSNIERQFKKQEHN